MRVLVFGARGWIGSQFVDILKSNGVEYVEATSRADENDQVSGELDMVQPTHVVSFIGRTHGKIGETVFSTIDYLEQEGKLVENVRDNLFSPLVLAELCYRRKIHFTYLGTGCIFKYDESHPFGLEESGFDEESDPNFFGSSYSVIKGYTDRLFRTLYDDSALNLRIRMPITGQRNPRNFITKITHYAKICSVPNSMTVLPEMLPLVYEMMRQRTVGTVNLTNPGLISHNEILEMYRAKVDPNFRWENFSQEEQRSILAADRSNNFLETGVLTAMFPSVRHIRDAVAACLDEYV